MSQKTMRAQFTVPGPHGGMMEAREIPIPAPGAGEVLIRVRATAINRGELLRRADLRLGNPAAKANRGGSEAAGEIAALGPGVSGWKAGDRVMGRFAGSYAEYTVAPQRALIRIPDRMSWVEAAAIPNVFITAHDAIVTNAELRRGESVMVTAASSGVGTAALQIARYVGASPVIATTRSPRKAEALRSLGATDVVDTTQAGWTENVMAATGGRGVDVIIDHVGGAMLPDNIRVMALKARLISVGRNENRVGECDLDEIARKRARIIGVTFRTRTPDEALSCSERFAADLLEPIARGELKAVVDRTFPIERVGEAQEYMLSNAQVGKIVLLVDEPA